MIKMKIFNGELENISFERSVYNGILFCFILIKFFKIFVNCVFMFEVLKLWNYLLWDIRIIVSL